MVQYYFQSVPTLMPGGFNLDTFYVQGKAENAGEAISHYSAIVNLPERSPNIVMGILW